MPRDGSGNYTQPFPNVVDGTTIESAVYNGFTNDVAADLNAPRPIVAGGTGATSVDQALFNLAAEKATQVVTNYDSHLWVPGSFRSATTATGAPAAGHTFAGVCYINEALANPPTNQNVVVEARDESDTTVPGRLYIREKKAGVWGAWVTEAAVRTDSDQNLTEAQKAQGRENIYAAPFDAQAYNGIQVNGSMEVNQTIPSAIAAGPGGTNPHAVDGWRVASAGPQVLVIQQAAGMALPYGGFTTALLVMANTPNPTPGGSDYCALTQNIEGQRVTRLGWGTAAAQPITIGFWIIATAGAGTYSGSVRNPSLARSYPFSFTLTTSGWEYKTVTIPGDTTGTWPKDNMAGLYLSFALLAGGTFLTTGGAWVPGNFFGVTGTKNAFAVAASQVYVTGVVILPGIEGPSAERSALIMRPYDQEVQLCRRYFYVLGDANLYPVFGNIYAAATGHPSMANLSHPVLMRVAPTGTKNGTWSTTNASQPAISTVSANGAAINIQALAPGIFNAYPSADGHNFTFDARF